MFGEDGSYVLNYEYHQHQRSPVVEVEEKKQVVRCFVLLGGVVVGGVLSCPVL